MRTQCLIYPLPLHTSARISNTPTPLWLRAYFMDGLLLKILSLPHTPEGLISCTIRTLAHSLRSKITHIHNYKINYTLSHSPKTNVTPVYHLFHNKPYSVNFTTLWSLWQFLTNCLKLHDDFNLIAFTCVWSWLDTSKINVICWFLKCHDSKLIYIILFSARCKNHFDFLLHFMNSMLCYSFSFKYTVCD